jgi:GntR family transcriptional regulator, transcriptional repressor for pyruvate dehydrogenase complex
MEIRHFSGFKEAKQSRTFEDVVEQIQEAILQGDLKEGDRLPNERQLKEAFRVSRGTLREALRALEQKRLIKIKTGTKGGAFICPINIGQISDSLSFLLRYQKISLRELVEFRATAEVVVAENAARKARKKDIWQLNSILGSMRNHLEEDELRWDEVMEKDKEFHVLLAEIAGNRIFESVLHTIYENINQYFEQYLPKDKKILKKVYRDLCGITEAIEKKNLNKTRSLAREHIKQINVMMRRMKMN